MRQLCVVVLCVLLMKVYKHTDIQIYVLTDIQLYNTYNTYIRACIHTYYYVADDDDDDDDDDTHVLFHIHFQ